MIKKIMLFSTIIFTAITAYASDNDEYVKNTIQTIMQENHIPGAYVALYVDGKPSTYTFGYSNSAKKEPITSQTIFEVGSITKLMTSLLLAKEVDLAKVQLDDPVNKYRKNLPETFDEISLLNLATHTSGLPFELDDQINSQDALYNYLKSWKATYEPDEKWIYSNVGMGLLGYTLEAVTHQNFNQQYRQNILKPLHMSEIGITVPLKDQKYLAQGYDEEGKAVAASKVSLFPAAWALKASGKDMQTFLAASIGLANISQNMLYPIRMTQTAYVQLSDADFQGLGWQIHQLDSTNLLNLLNATDANILSVKDAVMLEKPRFDGDSLIDKTGMTNGFSGYIATIPNKKTGIVLLFNKKVSDAITVKTARMILFKLNHLI